MFVQSEHLEWPYCSDPRASKEEVPAIPEPAEAAWAWLWAQQGRGNLLAGAVFLDPGGKGGARSAHLDQRGSVGRPWASRVLQAPVAFFARKTGIPSRNNACVAVKEPLARFAYAANAFCIQGAEEFAIRVIPLLQLIWMRLCTQTSLPFAVSLARLLIPRAPHSCHSVVRQ